MDEFDFVTDVNVRLRDVDAMGHVNNAVYLTYLEMARDRYVQELVGESLIERGAALVNVEIDFQAGLGQDNNVTVGVRVRDLGTASLTMDYEIRADGAVAATAETTVVTYDREADEAVPLPDAWRDAITAHEGL